jgi:hypothetical protein
MVLYLALILTAVFALLSGAAIEAYNLGHGDASARRRRAFRVGAGLVALVALGSLYGAVQIVEHLPR